MQDKIMRFDEVKKLSSLKKTKVLIGGCFDILHYGHLTFLKKAKQQGEVLIVLLESDEFIKTFKRRKPTHNQNERAEILAHLSIIDYIVKLPLMKGDALYFEVVKNIKPSVIAITEGDSKVELKTSHAAKVGGEVKVVVAQLPFSSSKYAPFFRN